MNRNTPNTRHIVLDTITEDGSFVWGCSDCYWSTQPTEPNPQLAAPFEAMQAFGQHSCADYRQKKVAA